MEVVLGILEVGRHGGDGTAPLRSRDGTRKGDRRRVDLAVRARTGFHGYSPYALVAPYFACALVKPSYTNWSVRPESENEVYER